jgi:hypothetical protein
LSLFGPSKRTGPISPKKRLLMVVSSNVDDF